MRRIAKNYNIGLEPAIAAVEEHNNKVRDEMINAGSNGQDIRKSLLELPYKCPEKLNSRWCSKFLKAFDWRKVARNTAGNYLALWLHTNIFYKYICRWETSPMSCGVSDPM